MLIFRHIEFPLARQSKRDVRRPASPGAHPLNDLAIGAQHGYIALSKNRHIEFAVGAKRHSVRTSQVLVLGLIPHVTEDFARSEAIAFPAIAVNGAGNGLVHVKVIVRPKGDSIGEAQTRIEFLNGFSAHIDTIDTPVDRTGFEVRRTIPPGSKSAAVIPESVR